MTKTLSYNSVINIKRRSFIHVLGFCYQGLSISMHKCFEVSFYVFLRMCLRMHEHLYYAGLILNFDNKKNYLVCHDLDHFIQNLIWKPDWNEILVY